MRSLLIVVAGCGVAILHGAARAQPLPQGDPTREPIPLIPELTPVPPPVVPRPRPVVPAVPITPAKAKLVRAQEREAAERLCAAQDPACDWMALLGGLERASVARTLAARGYEIEPAPWGKVIGQVHISNEAVFAEKNRVLQFLNHFHITTRERAIAKEVVIAAGEVWDQARVEETARRLRDPLWSSVVAVVPVVSKTEGQVDLLVVTRDVWSLRLNTKYAFSADEQGQKLTGLSVSLSENNFLGLRSVLAAAMTMDQSEISTGPLFIDKNLFGKHLDLRLRANLHFNRDRFTQDGVLDREGHDSTITIARTLWSLATQWAGGASFSHNFQVDRSYRGTQLRTYDDPTTPETEAHPYVYDSKVISASTYATRQWGKQLKRQITIGYGASSQRAKPYQFEGTAAQRAAFVRDVLPRTEVSSGPYVEYAGFQPVYKTLRNLQTYDLGEDARFGVDYSILVGAGAKLLGADYNHWRVSGSAGYTARWCRDGFVRVAGAVAIRHQAGVDPDTNFIDNTASGKVRFATPSVKLGRIVFDTTLATRWHDTQNRFYSIGSETGLRGFVIDEFVGDRVFNTQVEARSVPYALWALRVGATVFYELGGAANSLADMPLHHDAGFGVRMLIPQTSRELFRFDLAIPLDGRSAGTPRFIAGFESAF